MTEVPAKAARRRFTAAYKKKILQEVEACKERGEVGALLRREGLYSSHVAAWRAARDRGELANLEPRKRGPKAKVVDVHEKENAVLRRQVAHLEKRLAHTEALIEIQKKVAALLGNPIPESEEKS